MVLYKQIENHALLGIERAFFIYQFAKQTKSIPGDAAEIGVYKGGSAKIIATVFSKTKKTISLFDTFSGMPEVDEKEDNIKAIKKGIFSDTDLNSVKNFLKEFKRIKLYEGVFPKTSDSVAQSKFCFVHIDTDIYQSTKNGLEFFYPKMVSGGVIVCDDYKSPECKGVEKAVDEFFKNKKEVPIHTTGQQCAIIKL